MLKIELNSNWKLCTLYINAAEVDMLCGMSCVHLYHCIVVSLNIILHPLMKVCQCVNNYRGVECQIAKHVYGIFSIVTKTCELWN